MAILQFAFAVDELNLMPVPVRVLISEFLTGGSWPEATINEPLFREGSAMVLAVIEDFLKIINCSVLTTWDARLGAFPFSHDKLDVVSVQSPSEYLVTLAGLRRRCTHSLIIAPEFHGVLGRQIDAVINEVSLNCDRTAIDLCGDKLQLAEFLLRHRVPTIATQPFDFADPFPDGSNRFPIVIKPRDGAGSQCTFRIDNLDAIKVIRDQYQTDCAEFRFIQQPFIPGRSLSIAAFVPTCGTEPLILPLGEQLLSTDGRFQFLGSRVGGFRATGLPMAAESLIRCCCQLIPGLRGYVGFDLIEPNDRPGEVILVEINPRLTTSYLAYRLLAIGNLAPAFLTPTSLSWRPEECEYRIDQ